MCIGHTGKRKTEFGLNVSTKFLALTREQPIAKVFEREVRKKKLNVCINNILEGKKIVIYENKFLQLVFKSKSYILVWPLNMHHL